MHIVVEELITRRRCEDESVVEILNRQARREYVATIRGFVVVTDAAGLFQGFVITGIWVSLLVATLVVTRQSNCTLPPPDRVLPLFCRVYSFLK